MFDSSATTKVDAAARVEAVEARVEAPPRPSVQPLRDRSERRAHAILRRLLQGRSWSPIRLVTDLTLLYLAVLAAWLGASAAGVAPSGAAQAWVLPLLGVTLLALRGGYRSTLQVNVFDWVAQVVGATSLAAMSLLALESLLLADPEPSSLLIRAWVFGALYAAGGRVLLAVIQRGAQVERIIGKPTLIVGAGRVGAQVERRLQTHPALGLLPIGYLDADPLPAELVPGRRAPVLGAPSDLAQVAREAGAEHVIFAFLNVPDQVLLPLVRECHRDGLEMSLVPRLFDSVNSRVQLEHMGGLPLYGLKATDPRGWQFGVKHALGRALAATLLVVLSPLMLAVALAIRATSPGPVLFRQRRIGRDGRHFDLLKFRSMTTVAGGEDEGGSGQLRAVDDDLGPGGVERDQQHLTAVGGFLRRTSIDELPQLWNVIRREMALVGPRPERPEFVELFGQSIRRYDDRHRVKSGITGWAQVNGLRGQTSLADRVEWDNYYIENWSLWLDLKILLMTLAAPFHRAQ